MKNLSTDSRCYSQDSNRVISEYKVQSAAVDHPVWSNSVRTEWTLTSSSLHSVTSLCELTSQTTRSSTNIKLLKTIRYYSMGNGKVADESAGTLFQVSAMYGQESCHTSVTRRGFSPWKTEFGHKSVQKISCGECGNEAGFSHSTYVLPCQFSFRYCFTVLSHEQSARYTPQSRDRLTLNIKQSVMAR